MADISSLSGVNILITFLGKKNNPMNVAMPKQRDIAMPEKRAVRARCGLPAPIFCATVPEIAPVNDIGGSIVKAFILLVMPIAAEAATPPILLTVAIMNINDMLVIENCSDIGSAMRSMRLRTARFICRLDSLKSKP